MSYGSGVGVGDIDVVDGAVLLLSLVMMLVLFSLVLLVVRVLVCSYVFPGVRPQSPCT